MGKDILHPNYPDAIWSLAGLFKMDDSILGNIDFIENKYNFKVPIKSVFGSYGVRWSNGRGPGPGDDMSTNRMRITNDELIKEYNKKDIGCIYTFSNTVLNQSHLTDRDSNELLDILGSQNYAGNGIAISSDILSDYIRNKYPNLLQKASVLKIEWEKPFERTFEYYDSLADRFDVVYLHPDDNFQKDLLEKIAASGKVDKYEILVNECCTRGCPVRHLHHAESCGWIADDPMKPHDGESKFHSHAQDGTKSLCPIHYKPNEKNCMLTHTELKEIYDMGFRRLKLAGREMSWTTMAYYWAHYMLEPDFIAMKWFQNL